MVVKRKRRILAKPLVTVPTRPEGNWVEARNLKMGMIVEDGRKRNLKILEVLRAGIGLIRVKYRILQYDVTEVGTFSSGEKFMVKYGYPAQT